MFACIILECGSATVNLSRQEAVAASNTFVRDVFGFGVAVSSILADAARSSICNRCTWRIRAVENEQHLCI